MFEPSPVKSEDGLDDGRRHHNQHHSSYVLANSPHPVLDGVDLDRIRERQSHQQKIMANYGSSSSSSKRRESGNELPAKRPLYSSDLEFINAPVSSRMGDGSKEDGIVDVSSDTKIKHEEDDKQNEDQDSNNNFSDDEGQEGSTSEDDDLEIPTLETYIPVESSYEKANQIPFAMLCKRLETLWIKTYVSKKNRLSKEKRLDYILPDSKGGKGMAFLQGGSPFPYLRLILPDHDSSRAHTGLKEAKIADIWAKALGLSDTNKYAKQLKGYRNKQLIKNMNSVADLSNVVMDVMKERNPGSGSKLTIGEVNEWLDVLVDIVKDRYDMATSADGNNIEKSAWRKSLEKAAMSKRIVKKSDKYVKLVEVLINKNLSVSCSVHLIKHLSCI